MFTGIIEATGEILSIKEEGNNLIFHIKSKIAKQLKIDQSVSHNGVCLTVTSVNEGAYLVTAIDETLQKTNLRFCQKGNLLNLERAMKLGDRLDGHLVQGHIDLTGKCIGVADANGSWIFTFEYHSNHHITIEKGSITVNGVSLTVINSKKSQFSVAVIPYTFEHTNFKEMKTNDKVNLEFDLIGKYVAKLMKER